MIQRKYQDLLEAIAELIADKNHQLSFQEYEIANLKKQLEEAQKIKETEKLKGE